jgi:hypothetical protein
VFEGSGDRLCRFGLSGKVPDPLLVKISAVIEPAARDRPSKSNGNFGPSSASSPGAAGVLAGILHLDDVRAWVVVLVARTV